MATIKRKITDASTPELIEFARTTLGIPKGNLPDNTGRDKVIAKIKEVRGDDIEEIDVQDNPATALQRPGITSAPAAHDTPLVKGEPGAKPTASNGLNDPKVELTLFKTDKNLGKDIPVSVNGRHMLIPVGRPVEIPLRFFLALCDAVGTVFDFNETTNEVDVRDEPRHPFNVHSMPSKQERKEWDEALTSQKAA